VNPFAAYRFGPEQAQERERARRLCWLTIWLLTSAGTLMLLTSGQSQTMKTAWITDFLSLVPPIALLVAMRIELRPPSERFPYGYTRAISISFLVTAAVLSLFGVMLFTDAVIKLIRGERPPIGTVVIFGRQIWAGWTMIAALAYSLSCGFLVGRLKLPVAHALQDRALAADAKMNHDEWMSEGAAIAGLLLVGYGFWWGDAGSAALIALQIIRDAWETIQQVIADLMDEAPNVLDRHQLEDLPQRVRDAAKRYDWVVEAAVRLREHGRLITGDVFVVPREHADLPARVERAAQELATVDWRLHSLTVMPVARLDRTMPEHPG
jgi:cation diffusion facilitator family transporter